MAINRRESFTAEFAAAVRVAYARQFPDPVFDDSWAIRLLRPRMRVIVRSRWLSERYIWRLQRSFQGINGFAWSCFRWTEELVDAAVERGTGQYLILGAGLDTFAQRRADLSDRLRIFELDHPDTQYIKRERLARAKSGLPDNLELVPIDFNVQSLADVLASSHFDSDAGAIASWLNVIPYLPEDAVFESFAGLAKVLAPGSELVVNYPTPPESMDEEDRRSFEKLARGVASRGEPFRGNGYAPSEFAQRVGAVGFELVEERSTPQLRETYFGDRPDDPFRPRLGWRIARLRRRR